MGSFIAESTNMNPLPHNSATLELSEATINDIEDMVSVYIDAFSGNRLNMLMYGAAKREDLQPWLLQLFSTAFHNQPEIKHWKVTEHNSTSGSQKLVAWLRYEVPREGKTSANDEEEAAFLELPTPPGANLDLFLSFFGGLKQVQQKYIQYGEMCIGHLLAVLPSYQNQRVGQILSHHFVNIADRLGKPIYIEATAHGLPLYRKFGFREVDLLEFDIAEWAGENAEPERNWVMIREIGGRVNVPQSLCTDDAEVLEKLKSIEGRVKVGQDSVYVVKSKL